MIRPHGWNSRSRPRQPDRNFKLTPALNYVTVRAVLCRDATQFGAAKPVFIGVWATRLRLKPDLHDDFTLDTIILHAVACLKQFCPPDNIIV